jgi:hypothetical protein
MADRLPGTVNKGYLGKSHLTILDEARIQDRKKGPWNLWSFLPTRSLLPSSGTEWVYRRRMMIGPGICRLHHPCLRLAASQRGHAEEA